MTSLKRKPAEAWATEITAAWRSSIEGIFKCCRLLMQANAALEHGQFQRMIENELPFGPRTAQMLMKIGKDETRLANHGSLLPAHWRSLYELTKLSDQQLAEAVADGTIKPEMRRADIENWRLKGPPPPLRSITREVQPPPHVVLRSIARPSEEPPGRILRSITRPREEEKPMRVLGPADMAPLVTKAAVRCILEAQQTISENAEDCSAKDVLDALKVATDNRAVAWAKESIGFMLQLKDLMEEGDLR